MGAVITAQNIIDRAEKLLLDDTNTRWPATELQDYINDAQREIVLLRPDAYPTTATYTLTQTQTKQTIPSGGLALIDISHNTDVSGVPNGRAITIIDREVLDNTRPNWHTETEVAEFKHFTFDPRNPKEFFIYPPPAATAYVEMVYSSSPPDCAASVLTWLTGQAYALGRQFTEGAYVFEVVKAGTTGTEPAWPAVWKQAVADDADVIYQNIGTVLLTLDDIYAGAILDYVLYRAYSKDAAYAERMQKSQVNYLAFMQSLGIKAQVTVQFDPNIQNVPVNNPADRGFGVA